MPSPTEKTSTSTETLTNLKDAMEPSQEISHMNIDSEEVINQEEQQLQEPQEPQEQQEQQESQPQQQQQPQQQSQSQPQHTSTTSVATLESSPSQMIDATIVDDVVDATASASVIPPNDANPTTTTTTTNTTISNTENISQDTTDPPTTNKRKPVDRPRRRTRNTTKASQGEQSTTPKKILSAAPSQIVRRGTNDIDPNGPIEFTSSNGRQLPLREGISQSNIADRFVDFIMYCNPSAPEALDKSALIRYFNAVPKSDGKVFQTWSLYQLVGKHYAGEIRTWTKLAQKLGVVRTPEASPQKIQQYAVRLKKWMASVHVDAYFNYLLSRPNDYYQFPQKNTTEVDDESDVVLKLIKRAGSKRQKRKYTRKNTNSSNNLSNDEGTTNPEGTSATEFEDDGQFESEDADDGNDKHRDKRVRASYSDDNEGSEEEDRDPWMDVEDDDDEGEDPERPTESTRTNQRRKSVQVGLGTCWVKDNVIEEENENIVGGRLGVRKEAYPEYDSSRYYRQYPSQFASNLVGLPHLIEPKNGSDIPTPNPSPTTLPVMNLSSGNNTGNKRVLSHSGATGGAGTQPKYRWRMISMGPTYAVKTSADESYLTTSPSSSQKEPKKKQDAGQGRGTKQPSNIRPRSSPTIPSEQQITEGKNFAELLLPSTLPNNDKDSIALLQKNLVSAVGMLEDSQRRINMLNSLVHQRDEDMRQRLVRELKSEVDGVFKKFQ